MTARDDLRTAADAELARWERQLTDELDRFWDRQEAVVLARLQGTKARKNTRHWEPVGELKIDPRYVLDKGRWLRDASGVVTPVVTRLYGAVYRKVEGKVAPLPAGETTPSQLAVVGAIAAVEGTIEVGERIAAAVQSAVERILQGVNTAADEIQQVIDQGEADELPMAELAVLVRSTYAARRSVWMGRVVGTNVVGAVNEAGLMAAIDAGATAKQWLSSRDDRVRPTHVDADGQNRPIGEHFMVGGFPMAYPGDPAGPPQEVIRCRCTMLFARARQEKRFNPDQPRYPRGHPLGGQWLDSGDVARWLAGKPLKDGTAARDVDVPRNIIGSTAAPQGSQDLSQHDDLTVRTAADMLTPPADYAYPRVLNAPVATPLPRNKQTKVVSFRPGDVVEIDGRLHSVVTNRIPKGSREHELQLVDDDGQVTELRLPPSTTLTSIARSPHPTTVADARRVIAAAAEGREIPAAPSLRREVSRRELTENAEFQELLAEVIADFEQPDREVTAADLEQWRADWEQEYDLQAEADALTYAAEDDEFLAGWGTEWYSRPWAVDEPEAPAPPPEVRVNRLEQQIRQDYDLYVQSQYLAAIEATNAHIYSNEGKRQLDRQQRGGYTGTWLDDDALFRGKLPRKWASEELLEWFDANGRLTYTQFRVQALRRPDDEGKADADLESKARVRTAAGARQYGQPIGTVIVKDPPLSIRNLPNIGKLELESAGRNEDVRKVIAQRAAQRGEAVPEPARTRVIAAWDPNDDLAGYVVWQSEDGGAVPKGTVLQVWVHPSQRGQKVGDQLVSIAGRVEPTITGPQPATPGQPTAVASPAPQGQMSMFGGPAPAPAPLAKSATPLAKSAKSIPDRSKPGDQPGSSGDFDADAKRIDRLQRAYMGVNTEALYARNGRWARDRERQQQEIIEHFLSQPGIKSDRQILVLGGLPGAGKTTYLNSPQGQAELGINLSEYVTVNADEVKAQMVKRGMVPDYPGLSPDEAATLYHKESFEVAHSLMRQAAKRNLNFVYDTSLKSSGQLGFATGAGKATTPPPWRTTLVFVDVPVDVAKDRAKARYQGGGRYMPLALIDGMRSRARGVSSLPAEQFRSVQGSVDTWVHVENSAAPKLLGRGGRRSSKPAPPPPAPAPAPTLVAQPAAPAVPIAPTLNPKLPPVPPGAEVYAHPSGKHVYLLPDGSMEVWKPDGKRGTSSATPAKLRAGHGAWSPVGAAVPAAPAPPARTGTDPTLVPAPAAPPVEQPSAPAPAGAMPVVPMDFGEAQLSEVPAKIADPDYVFQQKVDGIRGVLVVEPGKPPWFASKRGERLQNTTAAKITTPILSKMPPTPPGSPAYRVEGELLNGKWHVFDMVVAGSEALPYEKRKQMADAWVAAVAPAAPQVDALPTARTAAEKQALWDKVLASGAEGVMMKRRDSPYNAGARVNHTLKAKVTATADVVVLNLGLGGKANAEIGLLVNGKVTSIGTVSTNGKGALAVGDVVEVEYLWATPDNTIAQPRIIRKRPDKTAADITDSSQLRLVDKTVLALAVKLAQLRLERAQLEVSS